MKKKVTILFPPDNFQKILTMKGHTTVRILTSLPGGNIRGCLILDDGPMKIFPSGQFYTWQNFPS